MAPPGVMSGGSQQRQVFFPNPGNQRLGETGGIGTAAGGNLGQFGNAMDRRAQMYSFAHGGVAAHNPAGPNAVQQARMQGPDQAAIQAEMQRRNMGAAMAGPGNRNAALAGYMMGQ